MILALFGSATLSALVYWLGFAGRAPSPRGSLAKTLATGMLALIGLMIAAPGLIVAGLAMGAAGDFALSRSGQKAFLAGMAAFALGHLAYAAAFMGQAPARLAAPSPLWAVAPLILLALSTELWLAPRTGALRWPVRGYVVTITAMGWAALALPEGPGRGLVQVGAALFLLSDLLLAIDLFLPRSPRLHRVLALALWPAYWLAQLFILVGGAGLLAPVLKSAIA